MDHHPPPFHGSHHRYVSVPTPQPPPRFIDPHQPHPRSPYHHPHVPFPPPRQDHHHPHPHHRRPDDDCLFLPYPNPDHHPLFLVDADSRRISADDRTDRLVFNPPPPPHLPVPRVSDRIVFPDDHPEARMHHPEVGQAFVRENAWNNKRIDDDDEYRARLFSERLMSFRLEEEAAARHGHPSSSYRGDSYQPFLERGVDIVKRKRARWEGDGKLEEDAPPLDGFDGRNQGRQGFWVRQGPQGRRHHDVPIEPLPSNASPASRSRNSFVPHNEGEACSFRNGFVPERGGEAFFVRGRRPLPSSLVSSRNSVSELEVLEKSIPVGSNALIMGNNHGFREKHITGKGKKMMFAGGSSQDLVHDHVKKPVQKPSVLTRIQFAKPVRKRIEEQQRLSSPISPPPPPCPPVFSNQENLQMNGHVELDVSFKSNTLVAKEILTPPSSVLSKMDGKVRTVRTPKGAGKETSDYQSSGSPNSGGKVTTKPPQKKVVKKIIMPPNSVMSNSDASARTPKKSAVKNILVPPSTGVLKADSKVTSTRTPKKKVAKEVLITPITVLPHSDASVRTQKKEMAKEILLPRSTVMTNSDVKITVERTPKMEVAKEILVPPSPITNSDGKVSSVMPRKKVKKKTKKKKAVTPVVQGLSSFGAREEICGRPTSTSPCKNLMHLGSTSTFPPKVPMHSAEISKGSILIQKNLVHPEEIPERSISISPLKDIKHSGDICDGPILTNSHKDPRHSKDVHERLLLTNAPRDLNQSELSEKTMVNDNGPVGVDDASSQPLQGVMLVTSLGKNEDPGEEDNMTSGAEAVYPEDYREDQMAHDVKDVRNCEQHLGFTASFKEISPAELGGEEQVVDLLECATPCDGEDTFQKDIIDRERETDQQPKLSPAPEFGAATNDIVMLDRENSSSATSVLHSHLQERSVLLHVEVQTDILYREGEREQKQLSSFEVSAEPELLGMFGEEKLSNDDYSRSGMEGLMVVSEIENTVMMLEHALPGELPEINLPKSNPDENSNKKDGSPLKSKSSSILEPKIGVKLDMTMLHNHSIPARLPPQKAKRQLTASPQVAGGEASTSIKSHQSSVIPRVFPRRTSLSSGSLKKPTSSSHNARHRTWHRTDTPSASPSPGQLERPAVGSLYRQSPKKVGKLHTSYIRKGNSLIRKSAPVAALPRSSPALIASNRTSRPETNNNMSFDSKADSTDHMICSKSVGPNPSFERPKTPPLPLNTKLLNCAANPPLFCPNPMSEDPLSEACREDQVIQFECQNFIPLMGNAENQTVLNTEKSYLVNAKRMIYVKHKSNQLVAAPGPEIGNSSNNVTEKAPALPSLSSSDLHYRRNKNQLILDTSSADNQSKQESSAAVDNSSSDGQKASKISSLKRNTRVPCKRRLDKAIEKTYRQSKFSLVWTLSGTHLHNKNVTYSKHWEVLPYLFPWKRTYWKSFMSNMRSISKKRSASLIRKSQLLRKRDTIYTISNGGFSLRKSGVRSIGGSNLKWSKSIEKHSKKASEEATLAVAEVERKKREQKGSAFVGDCAKNGNRLSRERIFRVGTARYKMDSSKRTLIRIPDEESSPPATDHKSGHNNWTSFVPSRLLIGNDEYIRIGNGNQLVRDPKKLVRILASEKVRWSLHTARLRLARKQQYCQFFTRFGKCNKEGEKCPYIHDPAKVAICTKFLKGLCFSTNCKLTHKVIPERMPDCSYFLQGLCTNKNCPYRHVNVNPKASVCEGFLKGYCADGDECRKKHSYVCPHVEATGECPQQSRCKLHHPKRGNKCKKRKRSMVQNCSRGRYFGSSLTDVGEPQASALTKHNVENGGDLFIREGRFAEYVSLDVDSDDDYIKNNDSLDSPPTQWESDLSDTHSNGLDALIKPVRIMKSL